jgi:type IV pilus assembly protein PilB
LRSILRHDPDKIMVGEIRDPETAQIAVQSALTGHLVFTTVHANNVFDVLGRFLHMGIDPYNFVSCLNCVAAQRLVRKICTYCKRPVAYSRETLEESGLDGARYEHHPFFEGAGCRECNGQGYHGRTAILELLDLTDDLREMILNKTSISRLKEAARAAGTLFLRDSAVNKVLTGVSTLDEINRVTFVEKVNLS